MGTFAEIVFSLLEKVGLCWWRNHEAEVKQQELAHVEETDGALSDADVAQRLRDEGYVRD